MISRYAGQNVSRHSSDTVRARNLSGDAGGTDRIWSLVAALLLLMWLAGCDQEPPEAVPSATPTPTAAKSIAPVLPTVVAGEEALSGKDRSAPTTAAADLGQLVRGNNAFAFDLYRALSDGDANLFFSTFSLSQALAMTSAGARGETLRQMEATHHYKLPQSELHPAFNALDLTLSSRGQEPGGTPNDGTDGGQYFRLNIANAIWGQDGYHFLPEFLDLLAERYGAGMMAVDFVGAPEQSRVRINDWVADETEEKVKDLLAPRTIDHTARLVLTNAIYFNASWLWQFDPGIPRCVRFIWPEAARWEFR